MDIFPLQSTFGRNVGKVFVFLSRMYWLRRRMLLMWLDITLYIYYSGGSNDMHNSHRPYSFFQFFNSDLDFNIVGIRGKIVYLITSEVVDDTG